MSEDLKSMSHTIAPKSDQLNADDLLTGPITVRVTAVKAGPKDQPVDVHIDGRMPYRPCKSMRRVLVAAWGDDGRAWVGRSMTLYCDPEVMFGGVKVGGIRISHLSHIDGDLSISLTVTRAKRAPFKVRAMAAGAVTSSDSGKKGPSPEAQAKIKAAQEAGRVAAAKGKTALDQWISTLNPKQREFFADYIIQLEDLAVNP